MPETVESLFWIALCAVLAPLAVGSVLRRKVPEVVVLLVLGVLIGPNVLDLAATDEGVSVLRELGLGMLFLLAGYEIEIEELVGRGGRRALWTWVASLAAALAVIGLLGPTGAIHAEVAVAIALTSTALGTLLPILKDAGLLGSRFGATLDEPRGVRRARADRGDGRAARHPRAGEVPGGAGRLRGARRARARLFSPGSAARGRGCCT